MKVFQAAVTLCYLLHTHVRVTDATIELTPSTYRSTLASGKNGMIKFYQPWCGHCTRMKHDWDRLASEADHSVFIADINCGNMDDFCKAADVTGYPTIRYFVDGMATDYTGGRSFEVLMDFVKEKLVVKCDIADAEGTCNERARAYITKWGDRKVTHVTKELERLNNMREKEGMTADLKSWINERIHILTQIAALSSEL
mmetsp:Transcript_32397/g.39816  ORF Transcript_32397/g.39816 Transcript_32397/m.39816 type:complete len:199 (-) Transcript_32397:69-665(-)|eukprot:CAMPEP_0172483658 /NCGR_PEP_ID=MMETSP1066-20121228/10720_1 /TAXON_ID=671091 /ORGANISM="Coscinodiscus wailesii, Strain CCMP2513" /LENGTH=198 /DNA_ID=CAMNT_0013247655 /DNA_START=150 /DNA_END=746 /DNA_ORIENTATION=-